jgi:hypothetical protein
MKKATRLLILTAFVLPLSLIGSAYAGGNGPIPVLRPYYSGSDHSGIRHSDPFSTFHPTADGFQPGADDNPLHLQDPIGGPGPDFNRDDLHDRFRYADRDPYAGAGPHYGDPSASGGQTAPFDGGITLLLAAGIGLGIRKARNRKQLV